MSGSLVIGDGTRFGRYEIVRELGAGGFGVVFEAIQHPMGKQVALKILHRHLVKEVGIYGRFLREAKTAGKLNHPNIVNVMDDGEHQGTPYIVMEFLEGESLSGRLKRDNRLALPEVLDLMIPILSAVAAVHESGIVHRDLKPANIFLARPRPGLVQPKLLDFGIARLKASPEHLTATGTLMGSAPYMSPEQASESREADTPSDQWSLGVILYRCLTGRLPFEGAALVEILTAILVGQFVAPRTYAPDLPPGVEVAILRAMTVDPSLRFPSVRAFGAALFPYAGAVTQALFAGEFSGETAASRDVTATRTLVEAPPPVHTISIANQVEHPSRPTPRRSAVSLTIGAAAVGALALGGLAWRLSHGSQPPHHLAVALPLAAVPQPPPPPVPARISVMVRAIPATATLQLDGEPPAVGTLNRDLLRDSGPHRIVASAPGYATREIAFGAEAPPSDVRLEPVVPPAPPAPVHVVTRHHPGGGPHGPRRDDPAGVGNLSPEPPSTTNGVDNY